MPTTRSGGYRAAGAVALIAAPALILASALVQPALKSDEHAQLQVILAHHDRYFWFTVLLLAGTMLLVPAFHSLLRMAPAASRPMRVGSALAVFGALVGVGDATTQFLIWQMATPGRNLGQLADVMQKFDNADGPAQLFALGGIALVGGTITLAVALYRAGVMPAWAGLLLGAGMIVNLIGFISLSVPVLVASSLMLLLSMGTLGFGLLREAEPSAPLAQTPTAAFAG